MVGFRNFAATVVGACVSGPRPTLLQTKRRAGFPALTHGTTTSETCRACSWQQQYSSSTNSTSSLGLTVGPPRGGEHHCPILTRTVHTRTPHARTTSPTTHLELPDRRADHREQPRRQRDQLRRKPRVRHTGGARRRRLPVPREQQCHEQLEPLQRLLRSTVIPRHTRRARARQENEGKACSADSGAFIAACGPVAVYP